MVGGGVTTGGGTTTGGGVTTGGGMGGGGRVQHGGVTKASTFSGVTIPVANASEALTKRSASIEKIPTRIGRFVAIASVLFFIGIKISSSQKGKEG
jgi:hypothetical protein